MMQFDPRCGRLHRELSKHYDAQLAKTQNKRGQAHIWDDVIDALPEKKKPQYTKADVDRVLSLGAGMTAMEFENAVSRAFVKNRAALPGLDINVLCNVLADVKMEVVKRSEVLELMKPIDLSQVGGLDELKAWIVDLKSAFTVEAQADGVDMPKGCALVGAPGC